MVYLFESFCCQKQWTGKVQQRGAEYDDACTLQLTWNDEMIFVGWLSLTMIISIYFTQPKYQISWWTNSIKSKYFIRFIISYSLPFFLLILVFYWASTFYVPISILRPGFIGGLLIFLILKILNIAYDFTILGGPLIFLIFVSKSNRTTKLNWREYNTIKISESFKCHLLRRHEKCKFFIRLKKTKWHIDWSNFYLVIVWIKVVIKSCIVRYSKNVEKFQVSFSMEAWQRENFHWIRNN